MHNLAGNIEEEKIVEMKENIHMLPSGAHLREFVPEDASELFSLIDGSRSHLSPWLAWVEGTSSIEDSKGFIAFALEKGKTGASSYAVIVNGRIAGVASYHPIDKRNKTVSLGYWLGSAYAGQGMAREAVAFLTTRAFETLGLNRVEIRCAAPNSRSRNLAERLGFAHEGTLKEAEIVGEAVYDIEVYGTTRRVWQGPAKNT